MSEAINMSDGTATRWNDTLYIITNIVRSLRSASDGKFVALSISDTLLVLWYLISDTLLVLWYLLQMCCRDFWLLVKTKNSCKIQILYSSGISM